MNSLIKKLAIVVLGSSLFGSMPMQAASPVDVLVNTGIIASIITVGAGLIGLYNGVEYFSVKDGNQREESKKIARYAFLVIAAAIKTTADIIDPLISNDSILDALMD